MAAFKNCLQKSFLNSYFSLQQVRYYPRWSHRRPVRVYTSEEYKAIQSGSVQKREEITEKFTPKIESNCETVERIEKATRPLAEKVEAEEVDDFGFEKIKQPKTVNLRRPVHKKEVPTVDMLETVIDPEGNLIYSKMKNKDNRITYVLNGNFGCKTKVIAF